MGSYRLEGDTYIIEEFDKLPAFSSFLPGLAGIKGIPLWVYYTNRGQGINSFGIHNKNKFLVFIISGFFNNITSYNYNLFYLF